MRSGRGGNEIGEGGMVGNVDSAAAASCSPRLAQMAT
jgi:hypothetical protein